MRKESIATSVTASATLCTVHMYLISESLNKVNLSVLLSVCVVSPQIQRCHCHSHSGTAWKIMDEGDFSDISVRTWVLTSSRERANP